MKSFKSVSREYLGWALQRAFKAALLCSIVGVSGFGLAEATSSGGSGSATGTTCDNINFMQISRLNYKSRAAGTRMFARALQDFKFLRLC